jgi:hypothetical protein
LTTAASGESELGAEAVGLQFEFLHQLHGGPELYVGGSASLFVNGGGDAIDQHVGLRVAHAV